MKKIVHEHIENALTLVQSFPLPARDIVVKWSKRLKTLEMSDDAGLPMNVVTPLGMFPFEFKKEELLTYIQSSGIKPIQMNPKNAYKSIQLLTTTEHSEQPILIESPLFPHPYILTGHAKLHKAIENNSTINVYSLGEYDFISLFKDDTNKGMYAFLRDLQMILDNPHFVQQNNLFYAHQDELFYTE